MAENAVAVDQGVLVCLPVAFIEVAPVAAVVSAHVGVEVDAECQRTGSGDGPATFQRRAAAALLSSRSGLLPTMDETPQADTGDWELVTWLVVMDAKQQST